MNQPVETELLPADDRESTAMVPVAPNIRSITTAPSGPFCPRTYTPEEVDVIKANHFKDLTDSQIKYALARAHTMAVDFFRGEVVVWPAKGKVVFHITISGARNRAEGTGCYFPGRSPTFEYAAPGDRKPKRAVAYVQRWDPRTSTWIEIEDEALWDEYGQTENAWGKHPHTMLAKCAEMKALRRAFPTVLGGFYVPEEFGGDEHGEPQRELPTPADNRTPPARRTAQPSRAASPRSTSTAAPTTDRVQMVLDLLKSEGIVANRQFAELLGSIEKTRGLTRDKLDPKASREEQIRKLSLEWQNSIIDVLSKPPESNPTPPTTPHPASTSRGSFTEADKRIANILELLDGSEISTATQVIDYITKVAHANGGLAVPSLKPTLSISSIIPKLSLELQTRLIEALSAGVK